MRTLPRHGQTTGCFHGARPWVAVQTQQLRTRACVFPGGRLLACGSARQVLLWDLASQSVKREFSFESFEFGSCDVVAFTPDGLSLLAGISDGTSPRVGRLRMWDVTSGSPRWRCDADLGPWINDAKFSASGMIFAISTWSEVQLRDTATGSLKSRFSVVRNAGRLEFSGDDRFLAVGCYDGTRVWSLEFGRWIAMMPSEFGCGSTWFDPKRTALRVGDLGDLANIPRLLHLELCWPVSENVHTNSPRSHS